MISAKIIADSVNSNGERLTTMEWTYPRFIHGQVMTHRKFSRNSASSRAIPATKVIEQVMTNPAVPIKFPREQPGMSGGEEVNLAFKAKQRWIAAGINAAESAMKLVELKVHKSVVNRILEPWMWHTIVVSSTEWRNFFIQRIGDDAQPEIDDLAVKAFDALRASVPQQVSTGGWHLPYVSDAERAEYNLEGCQALSVARVAGSSYGRLGTIREVQKDFDLFERLRTAKPPHWSPFEHVATPSELLMPGAIPGNFDGWLQLRHLLDEG